MKPRGNGKRLHRWLGLAAGLLLGLLCSPAWSWTEEVNHAASEVAGGNLTPETERIIFENNQTINRMGARTTAQGGLPNDVYVANQQAFTARNNSIIQDAASECGLEVDIKPPKNDPLAGTDTDVNFRSKNGKPVTYEQWKKFNDTYNAKVNQYLKKPPGTKVNTGTDLMPDPDHTSPAEFEKISTEINRQGGMAYKDPAAVRVEAAMAKGQPVPVNDVGNYVKELQGQANNHFAEGAKTTAEANALAKSLGENHPAVQDLRAKAQIENSQGAKYVDKITECGTKIREQAGVSTPQGQQPPSSDLTKTLRDNRGADTIAQSEAIGPLAKNALNNATQNTIQDLARVAQANPQAAPACQQAIAESLRDLPMSQKGQMMDLLQSKFGKDFAKGVATAAQGPTPGAQVMNGFNKVMKVVGPGLMIWDGYKRITNALGAPDEAKTYVAGTAIGGFVGGVGGAAALGLGAAAILGAPVTAIGAVGVIGASLVAGAVGYGYGDKYGSSLAGWMLEGVRPKDQSEYDALAAKGLLDGSKDIYGQLTGSGVPPDIAKAAADAYKRGDVKTFKEILSAVRDVLVKNAKKMPPRRFQDLATNEVQNLLDCLCSASLGANPWVMQGYNTNIPPGADPKAHSCGSLANGPCMAQGYGCWRSFIRWGNKGISDCLASFNLPTNSGMLRGQIDSKYQAPFDKPFKMDVKVEPFDVCPGDQVTVTVICEGGRSGYEYFYCQGWPLVAPPNSPKSPHEPTTSRSMTYTVEPTLRRGFFDGGWVYTRPAEQYVGNIWVSARSMAWDPVSQQEQEVRGTKIVNFRLRPHHECEKLKPTQPDETKKKPPVKPKTPVTKTSSGGGSGGGTSDSGGNVDTSGGGAKPPSLPPGKGTKTTGGGGGTSGPAGQAPGGGSGGAASSGGAGGGTSKGSAPQPPGGKPGGTPAPGEAITPDCAACLNISVDHQASASSLTLPGDQVATDAQGSATYAVQGCPNQTVRISVKGSDGWSGSAEGINKPASVTRPVGAASGVDEVTVENLAIPGCKQTFRSEFGPAPGAAAATNLDTCAVLSGGASGQGTSITDAGGQTTASSEASSWYRVEGPAGTQVKISVTGSDGWSGSAEGSGAATVTHPYSAGVSGTDSIVYENLSIPGCRKTAEIPFGAPDDLRGAEATTAADAAATAKPTAVLDGYAATTAGKAGQNTANGLAVMGENQGLQDASNVGNQTLNNAKRTVDAAGYAAQDMASKSQQKIKAEDRKDANILGEAILNGVGSGLQQAGQQFGAGMGSHVASEIFDSHDSKSSGGGSGSSGSKAGGAAGSGTSGGGSAPGGGGSSSAGGGGKGKPGGSSGSSGYGGGSDGEIMADALCPVCGQMYNPADGHQCPGAGGGGEIMADALCPVCGQMYNPAYGHECPGASQGSSETACDICGKTPASSVSTVDGGTKNMCDACKGYHRCPQCGKYAMEFHSTGYGYEVTNADGSTSSRSGSIEGVCQECIDRWRREHELP